MKWSTVMILMAMSAGCASDECVAEDGCDGEEESFRAGG